MRAVLHWRWPDLPIGPRRWILYNAILVTALMNLVLNAGITWLMVQGERSGYQVTPPTDT
jgi:hypothetical protein